MTSETQFLHTLQEKAKEQAVLEQSSPLPLWTRPFFSVIGLHYWQFLIIASLILAIPLSILGFPFIYTSLTMGQ